MILRIRNSLFMYLSVVLLSLTVNSVNSKAEEIKTTNGYQVESKLNNGEIGTVDVDFSEATAFDIQTGAEVDPQLQQSTVSLFAAGTGGGSTVVIPGGTSYRGVTVTQSFSGYRFSYKVDYTIINGQISWGPYGDRIDRIYGVNFSTDYGGSITSQGVFRARETAQYSAYGGVKAQINSNGGGNYTVYCYIRVGGDRMWLDNKLN